LKSPSTTCLTRSAPSVNSQCPVIASTPSSLRRLSCPAPASTAPWPSPASYRRHRATAPPAGWPSAARPAWRDARTPRPCCKSLPPQ
jgi:hypothetical protein